MITRANNPRRAFAETISLVAWQTEFDGKTGVADLFVDAVFDHGRVGGDIDTPVTFRMSLKRAEVHVLRDSAGVLQFPADRVARLQPKSGTKSISVETSALAKASGSMSGDTAALTAKAQGSIEGQASMSMSEKSEFSESIGTMTVSHRAVPNGYAFVIRPRSGDRLAGPAWATDKPRLSVLDTGRGRKRGEPPAVRVELHCRREDLLIDDVQFTDKKKRPFWKLSRLKQVSIEQYIYNELMNVGFEVGSLNNAFSQLVLADVSPELIVRNLTSEE